VALRILHFFSPQKIQHFFEEISKRLQKNGLFIFSGFSLYNLPLQKEHNVFFRNSHPVEKDNDNYRELNSSKEVQLLRSQQNLGNFVHLFDIEYVNFFAKKYNLRVVLSGYPSTGIVEGFILIRE